MEISVHLYLSVMDQACQPVQQDAPLHPEEEVHSSACMNHEKTISSKRENHLEASNNSCR